MLRDALVPQNCHSYPSYPLLVTFLCQAANACLAPRHPTPVRPAARRAGGPPMLASSPPAAPGMLLLALAALMLAPSGGAAAAAPLSDFAQVRRGAPGLLPPPAAVLLRRTAASCTKRNQISQALASHHALLLPQSPTPRVPRACQGTAVSFGGPADNLDPHVASGGVLDGSCGEAGRAGLFASTAAASGACQISPTRRCPLPAPGPASQSPPCRLRPAGPSAVALLERGRRSTHFCPRRQLQPHPQRRLRRVPGASV